MLETGDMKLKVFVVLDTNVVVSIARNHDRNSPVYQMGQLIEKGNIIPLFDERLISEYYAVLNHAKWNLLPELIDDYMNMLLVHGIYVKDVERLAVLLQEEAGVPFYRVTLSISESDSEPLTEDAEYYPKDFHLSPSLLLKVMQHIEKSRGSFLSEDYVGNYVQITLKIIREMREER